MNCIANGDYTFYSVVIVNTETETEKYFLVNKEQWKKQQLEAGVGVGAALWRTSAKGVTLIVLEYESNLWGFWRKVIFGSKRKEESHDGLSFFLS